MAYAYTAKKALHRDERIWFFSLLSIFCFVCMLYMYFVVSSVAQVVMRKELDHQVTLIHGEMRELEVRYIKAQSKVSADIASQGGYVAVEKKVFIDRTPATLVLSSQNES